MRSVMTIRQDAEFTSLLNGIGLLVIIMTIAALSLISPHLKPTLGLGTSLGIAANHIDHAIAYATGAALAWLFIMPRLPIFWTSTAFILLAGLMELSQYLSPGRSPKFSDFLASSCGVVIGLTIATAITLSLRTAENVTLRTQSPQSA